MATPRDHRSLQTIAVTILKPAATTGGSTTTPARRNCRRQQKALEDLVSVNSLFTIATFVGLAIAQPGERSLETRSECEPDNDMGKRLVLSEVIAFSFFLMSSLVAKTLKVHLDIYRDRESKSFRLKIIRGVMLLLCGWGSILGCLFLTTSMVEVIQIKVGRLSCGSEYAMKAVGALIGIVLLAMAIYIPFMMHAIYVSMKKAPYPKLNMVLKFAEVWHDSYYQ